MSLIKRYFIDGAVKVFSQPKMTIPLVTSLGLTLGAVLFVASMVHTLMLKPLAGIKDAENLSALTLNINLNEEMSIPYWNFKRIAHLNKDLSDIGEWAGISASQTSITVDGSNILVTSYNASNNILEVLGTQLIKGNELTIENPQNLVWISNSLWQSKFGGLSSAIDSPITLNGQQYAIAGVIEDLMSFDSEEPIIPQQVWLVTDLADEIKKTETVMFRNSVQNVIVRAKEGVTTLPTEEEILEWQSNFIETQTSAELMAAYKGFLGNLTQEVQIESYRDTLLGETRELIIILLIAVLGLLIMATLNLLNLFIAHYQGRTKEFGIQLSLGATVNKIRMLLFFENLPNMVIATIAGLLTAGWILRLLPIIAQNNIPMIDQITLDYEIIFVAVLVVIVLNVLFSFIGLVDVNKHQLMDNISGSGKGTKQQTNDWISKSLMVFQLSIASCLLTASIMLAVKSYQLVHQELTYNYHNTREFTVNLQDEEWVAKLQELESYHTSEVKRVEEDIAQIINDNLRDSELIIPSFGPLSWAFNISMFADEDNPEQQIMFSPKRLEAGYFDAFNISFLAGSDMSQEQQDNQELVTVIDETAAKTFFPDISISEVVGQKLTLGQDQVYKIIGVVPTVKSMTGREINRLYPVVYLPPNRFSSNQLIFTFKMPDDIEIDDLAIEKAIQAKYPGVGEVTSQTLNELWYRQTETQRTSLSITIGMTLLTILLACIGVGGLTHMTTNHRKHEIAVRIATGAAQSRILKMLFSQMAWMLLIGLGLGFAISVLSYDLLKFSIAQLPSFDWHAMVALNILLISVVCVAIALPAWQIIRNDPMKSLREE